MRIIASFAQIDNYYSVELQNFMSEHKYCIDFEIRLSLNKQYMLIAVILDNVKFNQVAVYKDILR